MLQVLFYAQMAMEAGFFDISDVAESLNAKLVRRHPHVFSDMAATDAGAVLRNWEVIKRREKNSRPEAGASLMDEVPRSMPAMLEAGKLGSKAAKVGFDWPNTDGLATELFDKLEEEIAELKAELLEQTRAGAAEAELGDILFAVVNLARHLKIDPESALRTTNTNFRSRFGAMEAACGGAEALEQLSLGEQEELWVKAKAAEGIFGA